MIQDMAKQPKAKPGSYDGELKTAKFQVLFTQTGLNQLDELAERLGLSRSDLLEKMARALYATKDGVLIQAFLNRAVEGDRHD